jgi:hypothetical protein
MQCVTRKCEWLLFYVKWAIFQLYHGETRHISMWWQWCLLCTWPTYSVGSLKQQYTGRHVAPLGRIILILIQPVSALTPSCCMLSGEAANTNFIVWFDPSGGWTHDLLEASTLTITPLMWLGQKRLWLDRTIEHVIIRLLLLDKPTETVTWQVCRDGSQ